jgi:hypothetical protein
MSVRFLKWPTVIVGALLLALSISSVANADPASDLVAAEEVKTEAQLAASTAAGEVRDAEGALRPVDKRADAADRAAEDAESEVERVKEKLVSERTQAAAEIVAGEASYEDEKSTHETITTIGISLAVIAAVGSLALLILNQIGRWPVSGRLTQIISGGLAVVFVGGLALALVPSAPDPPTTSKEAESLAADAEGDPADPPSQELIESEVAARPLAKKALLLDGARDKAEAVLADAESNLAKTESSVEKADDQVEFAANVVKREEREEAKEAEFREEATSIDYDQLIKNPYRYIGEKVVYTGQIFQIQEGAGSFMLLSVTDEGYGFWTDEVWVAGFGEVESAEEDIITVYGTVTGAEEYETAIGGSNYVPRIKAKYIDE